MTVLVECTMFKICALTPGDSPKLRLPPETSVIPQPTEKNRNESKFCPSKRGCFKNENSIPRQMFVRIN